MQPAFCHLSSSRPLWRSDAKAAAKPGGACWRRKRRPAVATAQQDPVLPPAGQARSSTGLGNFGFQCNERLLQWDESAQRRLIKIYVAKELDTTVEAVDAKLLELSVLLPDLGMKLDRLKADLVLQLVRDTPALVAKLLAFRELLPTLDLSSVLAAHPQLLLKMDPPALEAQLGELRAALPGVDLERVIEREPLLLLADVRAVLAEIKRLLPGRDPVRTLVADPTIVLDMKAAGLPASLEIDDGIKA